MPVQFVRGRVEHPVEFEYGDGVLQLEGASQHGEPSGLFTLGGCLSGWVASIVGGFAQACLVGGYSDGDLTFGDTETKGGGGYWTLAAAGAGFTVQGSNAKKVCDMTGAFNYAGASGGEGGGIGVDGFAGNSDDGKVVGIDVSAYGLGELPDPLPAEAHGGKSITTVHSWHVPGFIEKLKFW
jgi:hypothetical protein